MPEAEIGWIAAIIVGGLAGWLAEMFMKSGTGILMNIILGIVGAALANWLLDFQAPFDYLDRLKVVRITVKRRSSKLHLPERSLKINEIISGRKATLKCLIRSDGYGLGTVGIVG